jgi:hypothetical protein
MTNTFAKYSEIFSDSSICNFSKSPCSFYRHIFFTLLAPWFDSYKTFHVCLAVVTLATTSKDMSSRHWWMIVSASWSFFHAFYTASLWAEVNVALSIGSSKLFSIISHTSWESSQYFTRILQVS